MAESITRWVLSINCVDGAERPCGNSFYVPQAEAVAWNAAADDAARVLTDIGVFIDAYLDESLAIMVSVNVGKEIISDPIPAFPANTVLRGNKLQFSTGAGGKRGVFNLPARNPANYTQDAHSLEVSVTVPLAMNSFVSDYDALVVDAFGNPSTILAAKVVD